ncbi:protein phosphatase 2C domain-containing protein [Saccharothrix sp. Mg75]|uniref:protein phosphatase 2C domain-containing protein n=1 Tax=Saccharothrix sp. Mg75 TaxID=3445357 RepID=UPI003EEB83D0
MRAELDSQPGSFANPNEDWAAATNRIAVLLDGLTAPGDLGTGCIHGVPWFVERLGSALVANLADDELDMRSALAASIQSTARIHAPTCDLKNPGTPSATVLALREGEEYFDWLVLADSTLLLDCTNEFIAVSDDRVARVNRAQHEAAVSSDTGTDEHEKNVSKLVEAQRLIRNTPGGYWVAGTNPKAAAEALTGSTPKALVKRAALLSDGAARLKEFNITDWSGIMATLDASGPRGLISAVREVEDSDPTGRRWPRYKKSDDATAVYLTFD